MLAFKKKLVISSVILFLFTYTLSANSIGLLPDDVDFWSDYPADILADTITDRMTDDELLAQILMFGWAGLEPSDLLVQWVSNRELGSIKVFGWNTTNIIQVANSVSLLQKKAQDSKFKIPLFVATDQEGGWIRHVKGETSDTPGNLSLGADSYPIDAYYSGFYINREIRCLGININFAPSVDLYTNLDSSIIGPRSFGSDPVLAGVLGNAFSNGTIAAGVIPTAKHFPGHGDTSLDSHGKLPEIQIDINTLLNRELVPFKYLIEQNIPAIMSGHLSFPQITGNGEPASLSKFFLTDLLKNQLGFKGLIITDDMMMNGAISYSGSLAAAVTMAIKAGNDIIISSSTPLLRDDLWTENLSLMKKDEEFRETVKKAARHVIYTKLQYFKSDNHAPIFPDASSIYEYIPDKEAQPFFLQQACRSTTLYKAEEFPVEFSEGETILLAGTYSSFFEEGLKRFPDAKKYFFSSDLASNKSNYDTWQASSFVSTAKKFDTVIINVSNEHSAAIAKRLKGLGVKVIILSVMSPVPELHNDWADVILCGYSYSSYTFKALFAALKGDFIPEGTMPLTDTN